MNIKFGLVVGAAAACVVMAGCKAPKAQGSSYQARSEASAVKPAPETPATPVAKSEPEKAPAPAAKPETAPAPVVKPAPAEKPAEEEYTVYRVKGGDMLSSICATYGIKQSKVLQLNPGMDANKLYVGRTIKLPGKINLKDADAKSLAKPVAKKQAKAAKSSSSRASSYTGDTKEYVVKGGDTLGKIAYSNGITIKCLKDMNGLKKNMIRIGQKLKVPASKPVVAAKDEKVKAQIAVKQEEKKEQVKTDNALAPVAEEVSKPAAADAVATDQSVTPPPAPEQKTEPAVAAPAEPVAPATEAQSSEPEAQSLKTHTVAPGEDAVSIAIRYEISPSVVLDLNNLTATDQLTPGQVLKLPANAKMQ